MFPHTCILIVLCSRGPCFALALFFVSRVAPLVRPRRERIAAGDKNVGTRKRFSSFSSSAVGTERLVYLGGPRLVPPRNVQQWREKCSAPTCNPYVGQAEVFHVRLFEPLLTKLAYSCYIMLYRPRPLRQCALAGDKPRHPAAHFSAILVLNHGAGGKGRGRPAWRVAPFRSRRAPACAS